MAGKFLFGCIRDRFINLHLVIIKQFLAGFDVAHGINKDPVIFLDGFAVWIA